MDTKAGGAAVAGSAFTVVVGNFSVAVRLHPDSDAPGGKISEPITLCAAAVLLRRMYSHCMRSA